MSANSITGRENFAEVMKAYSSDGVLLRIIDSLTEQNDMIADAPVRAATDITTDAVARVLSYPTVAWKKLGEGWTATMGRLQNDTEGIGTMKARAQINVDLIKIQPDPEGYRARKEGLFVESMNQEAANTFVYGDDTTAPEEFRGLDVRFNDVDAYTPHRNGVFNNGESAGSTNSSIWLIQWDKDDCTLIYPKNHPSAGLTRMPKPEQLLPTTTETGENVDKAWFYLTEFEWSIGFSLGDLRRVKRQCNINSDPDDAHSWNEDVTIQARNNFKTAGQIFVYCNETIYNQVWIRTKDKGNVWMNENSPFGKPVPYILDMPVRRMDAITNAESVYS